MPDEHLSLKNILDLEYPLKCGDMTLEYYHECGIPRFAVTSLTDDRSVPKVILNMRDGAALACLFSKKWVMNEELETILNQRKDSYLTALARINSALEIGLGIGQVIRKAEYTHYVRDLGYEHFFDEFQINRCLGKLLTPEGNIIQLTHLEYKLLDVLARQPGLVVARKEMYRELYDGVPIDDALEKLVSRVRAKIEPQNKSPKYLLTHRGNGYLLASLDECEATHALLTDTQLPAPDYACGGMKYWQGLSMVDLPDGTRIMLSGQKNELMWLLAQRAGSFVPRTMLIDKLYHGHPDPSQSIDRLVCRLRADIHDTATAHRYIVTCRGRGYKLVQDQCTESCNDQPDRLKRPETQFINDLTLLELSLYSLLEKHGGHVSTYAIAFEVPYKGKRPYPRTELSVYRLVTRLRQKIEPFGYKIQSKPGIGYRMEYIPPIPQPVQATESDAPEMGNMSV